MNENLCRHCRRPQVDPDNSFCSAECQALGHLGTNRDPDLLLAIRQLAQYERAVVATAAHDDGNLRVCGNCCHADKWLERGAWDLDCGLHGKAKIANAPEVFAWRDRFIDGATFSDDADALYCDQFMAAGVQP